MELSNGKKLPRNLSKQKSCGQLLHQRKHDHSTRYNRGCLTPNPKATTNHAVQRSESSASKFDLKRPFAYSNSTENLKPKSSLKRTPRSGKCGTFGTTPRSTPAGIKSQMGTQKGKIKRDLEKDSMRPKKRLAIAYDEDGDSKQDEPDKDQHHGVKTVLDRNGHLGCGMIPIAEIKPLPIVNKLDIGDQYDVSDGRNVSDLVHNISTINSKAYGDQKHHLLHEEKKQHNLNMDSGSFSVYVAVRVRPFSKRYPSPLIIYTYFAI